MTSASSTRSEYMVPEDIPHPGLDIIPVDKDIRSCLPADLDDQDFDPLVAKPFFP